MKSCPAQQVGRSGECFGLKAKAYAKINLTLDIIGKREDGYHELSTVMQSISLCDDIEIKLNDSGRINISCDAPGVPLDKRNTMYKAAEAVLSRAESPAGADIRLTKRIPSEAGLGGGSADAAAVIRALNKLLDEKLSETELFEIAAGVGADVPFCLKGGTCLCEGIGEKLTALKPMPDCFIVIVKPEEGVSTAEAYRAVDSFENTETVRYTPAMLKALDSASICDAAASAGNRFDAALAIPVVRKIEELLTENGALCAVMTGSGSAVFGIFDDKTAAENIIGRMSGEHRAFLCRPLSIC